MKGAPTEHVALVTGAGSGIGAAIARELARREAAVVCTDISGERARAVAADIIAHGGRAKGMDHNIANRIEWEAVVEETQREFGLLTVAVNNAGLTRDRSFAKMSDEEWTDVVDVNLRGTFLGCQYALRAMRERGWGRIVNVSSYAVRGAFGQANYSAAKAGIVGLTRTAALEGARFRILANAVAPGSIDTPMLRDVPEPVLRSFEEEVPLGRFGSAEEVAAVVAFLASAEASYITGQVVAVDGGASVG